MKIISRPPAAGPAKNHFAGPAGRPREKIVSPGRPAGPVKNHFAGPAGRPREIISTRSRPGGPAEVDQNTIPGPAGCLGRIVF